MAKKNGKKSNKATSLYVPPVIEHSKWDKTENRVELFSIETPAATPDGEPTVVHYDMPGTAHVGLGLAMLRMARIHGDMIALSWLLEECVGEVGYMALSNEPDLEQEDLRRIMFRARDIVLGGLEAPKD